MQKSVMFITNSGIGLYSFRFELIEELKKQGYNIKLVYSGTERRQEFEKIGCECINVPFNSASTNVFGDIALLIKFKEVIQKIKPDIVLLYTIKPCIYAGVLLNVMCIPYISTVTGISPALISKKKCIRVITKFLSRIGYSGSKIIYFQNKMNEELFTKMRIGPNKHMVISGSGVNLEKFKYINYPPNDNILKLLYVGRVIKIKGIEELVYAIQKAKNNGLSIQCKIVGEYKDVQPFFEYALKYGIVDYEGETDDIRTYLSWCDALVLPSYGEGMSNVLQEASSCGRPVLASNIPGCKEIFEENVTGFGFEPRNLDSLYEAIQKLYKLPYEKRREMGVRAREKMKKDFDRRKIVKIYTEKIRELIGEN